LSWQGRITPNQHRYQSEITQQQPALELLLVLMMSVINQNEEVIFRAREYCKLNRHDFSKIKIDDELN